MIVWCSCTAVFFCVRKDVEVFVHCDVLLCQEGRWSSVSALRYFRVWRWMMTHCWCIAMFCVRKDVWSVPALRCSSVSGRMFEVFVHCGVLLCQEGCLKCSCTALSSLYQEEWWYNVPLLRCSPVSGMMMVKCFCSAVFKQCLHKFKETFKNRGSPSLQPPAGLMPENSTRILLKDLA
jgi:hypothetical protein